LDIIPTSLTLVLIPDFYSQSPISGKGIAVLSFLQYFKVTGGDLLAMQLRTLGFAGILCLTSIARAEDLLFHDGFTALEYDQAVNSLGLTGKHP
jgi:hypothetical protein